MKLAKSQNGTKWMYVEEVTDLMWVYVDTTEATRSEEDESTGHGERCTGIATGAG